MWWLQYFIGRMYVKYQFIQFISTMGLPICFPTNVRYTRIFIIHVKIERFFNRYRTKIKRDGQRERDREEHKWSGFHRAKAIISSIIRKMCFCFSTLSAHKHGTNMWMMKRKLMSTVWSSSVHTSFFDTKHTYTQQNGQLFSTQRSKNRYKIDFVIVLP